MRSIEKKIDQLIDRLIETTSDTVIAAYEKRVRDLEIQKALANEKIANCGRPLASFGETYRTAMEFLANPWKLWRSDRLEDRRAVLKLVFAERLPYDRKNGYRTGEISMPFKLLGDMKMHKSEMVQPPIIEPVDPCQRGELNRLEASLWSAPMDHLGLVEVVNRLGQRVVVTVANVADGRFNAGLRQTLRVADADILKPPVGMMHQATAMNRLPFVQGLLESVEHEARMRRSVPSPANDATGVGVDD